MRLQRLAVGLIVCFSLVAPAIADDLSPASDYVVRPGDNSYAIRHKYQMSIKEFARFNPGINARVIRVGSVVRVKSAAPVEAVVKPAQALNTLPEPARPEAKSKHAGYLSYYDSPTNGAKEAEPSVAASLLRVILSLAFVVAIACLSLLALKHFTSGKNVGKSPRRTIRVLETAGLGTNRALHVVQIGGRRMLIGSTSGQINLISEMDASEIQEVEAEQPADFASFLHRFCSTDERANTASTLGGILRDGASFLAKKTSAVRSLRKKANADE